MERLRFRVIGQDLRSSCKRANLVMVQTPTMRRWVEPACSPGAARIEVFEPCPPFLPSSQLSDAALGLMRSTPPDRRLLYVGNASAYKNLGILPGAMRELRTRMPGAMLFATIPPDHPLCRSEGIAPVGSLSGSALREAYGLARALIMPSLVETVGLPMLEAASLGLPVIAADRAYARDVCRDTALFFDPLQSSSLASVVVGLLGNAALHSSLATKGRALMENRTAERPYQRMIEAVLSLVVPGRG
jgi:glycosyltransferase involved in cell wall biosynthesis